MAVPQINSNALAADSRSLNALKLQAGLNTPASIKEAAKQFESLFMRELIKSMRDATMKSGLLDSASGDLGQDLLDQQLAVHMSGMPGGLSDMIARQLSRQMAPADGAGAPVSSRAAPAPEVTAGATASANQASLNRAGRVRGQRKTEPTTCVSGYLLFSTKRSMR